MKLSGLSDELVKAAAEKRFGEQHYFKLCEDHVFLKHTEEGTYQSDWLDHEFFVSTNYAYENILVNGNKTRYLVKTTGVWIMKNPYDIIYDPQDRYYYAYEEENEIKFENSQNFFEKLEESVKKID